MRLAKWAFWFGGVRHWVQQAVNADTVKEQGHIWEEHIKPVVLTPWITRLFLANP